MSLINNYFAKLVKYIKNVYNIDNQIKHFVDNRVNPTYKTSQIISLVLTAFLLRIQSFNQLNFRAISGQSPKTSITRRFSTPFCMYQIRRISGFCTLIIDLV